MAFTMHCNACMICKSALTLHRRKRKDYFLALVVFCVCCAAKYLHITDSRTKRGAMKICEHISHGNVNLVTGGVW